MNPGHFGLQFVCHCFTVLQSLRKVAAAIPHTKSSGHVTNRCTSWNYIVCLVPCPIFAYLLFISPGILIVIACRRHDGHISHWRSNRLDNVWFPIKKNIRPNASFLNTNILMYYKIQVIIINAYQNLTGKICFFP